MISFENGLQLHIYESKEEKRTDLDEKSVNHFQIRKRSSAFDVEAQLLLEVTAERNAPDERRYQATDLPLLVFNSQCTKIETADQIGRTPNDSISDLLYGIVHDFANVHDGIRDDGIVGRLCLVLRIRLHDHLTDIDLDGFFLEQVDERQELVLKKEARYYILGVLTADVTVSQPTIEKITEKSCK